MKSEDEIIELRDELDKLTGFISESCTDEEFEKIIYACNITDAFLWILEEITTENFNSDSYLKLDELRKMSNQIEKRTGNIFEDYQ